VEAARIATTPALDLAREKVDAAVEVLTPRVVAARQSAGPAAISVLAAAGAAAAKAAADLAPRLEAAQEATRTALAVEVAPRVVAARDTVGPALGSARDSLLSGASTARDGLVAGVGSALGELEARRAALVGGTSKAVGRSSKTVGKGRRRTKRTVAKTRAQVWREVGRDTSSRRWPWVLVALAVGAATFAFLRRRKEDPWTPAPAGDGPVPSYREDPVPSSPSDDNAGKTVSSAMFESGDSAPPEDDMGIRDAQFVAGDGGAGETDPTETAPEPFTSGGGADEGPTAGPAAGQA
jgi:hypothetical protein